MMKEAMLDREHLLSLQDDEVLDLTRRRNYNPWSMSDHFHFVQALRKLRASTNVKSAKKSAKGGTKGPKSAASGQRGKKGTAAAAASLGGLKDATNAGSVSSHVDKARAKKRKSEKFCIETVSKICKTSVDKVKPKNKNNKTKKVSLKDPPPESEPLPKPADQCKHDGCSNKACTSAKAEGYCRSHYRIMASKKEEQKKTSAVFEKVDANALPPLPTNDVDYVCLPFNQFLPVMKEMGFFDDSRGELDTWRWYFPGKKAGETSYQEGRDYIKDAHVQAFARRFYGWRGPFSEAETSNVQFDETANSDASADLDLIAGPKVDTNSSLKGKTSEMSTGSTNDDDLLNLNLFQTPMKSDSTAFN